MIEQVQQLRNISTHALTEGDKLLEDCLRKIIISTHALTEGDEMIVLVLCKALYFNSRPHGGRRWTLRSVRE